MPAGAGCNPPHIYSNSHGTDFLKLCIALESPRTSTRVNSSTIATILEIFVMRITVIGIAIVLNFVLGTVHLITMIISIVYSMGVTTAIRL